MAKKMSARMKIDRSRERRLWAKTLIDIAMLAVSTATLVNNSPELKCKVEGVKFEAEKKISQVKSWFKK